MKKPQIFTALVMMIVTLSACGENATQKNAATSADSSAQMHMHHDVATQPDFSGITFASKKDTTCHMPLSAGIADTAVVDGKVYGFCSKECKEEFVKTLNAKAHH